MKKITKIIMAVITVMLMSSTVQAAEIPRESAPLNATEEQIVIVENLICDILDEVAAGKIGYTEAAGAANTRVRKAVVAGETNDQMCIRDRSRWFGVSDVTIILWCRMNRE